MRSWSKAVGAGLGYFVGGPLGAVLGYLAGHKLAPQSRPAEGHLLITNILGFTAELLKVNPTPSSEEIGEAVSFISRLFQLDAEDERLACQLLDRLLATELDIAAMALTFKRHSDAPMRKRLLEILSTLCLLVHGPLAGRPLTLLTHIAEVLNIEQAQWQALQTRYQASSPTLDMACCYALLEVNPDLPPKEIRAAYRRLAKKYHPDRSAHLEHGTRHRSEERMTLINAAYGAIRQYRGF